MPLDDHPLKEPCKQVLHLAARYPGAFFTDAEVLQEMLHRYLALKRWPGKARRARLRDLDEGRGGGVGRGCWASVSLPTVTVQARRTRPVTRGRNAPHRSREGRYRG